MNPKQCPFGCFFFFFRWSSVLTEWLWTNSPSWWRTPEVLVVPVDVHVAEPPPLGFYHMFGNKEVEVQVLENICGHLVEGYGDEVGRGDVTNYNS